MRYVLGGVMISTSSSLSHPLLLWHSLLKDKSSLSSMTGVSLLFMGVVMVMPSAHLL